MRHLVIAFFGALVCAHSAAAQQQTQISAADFAAPASMSSASLSPDGRYAASIQSVPGGEALVVIDWRSGQSQAIQVARHDRSLYLEGVAWKNDNRLLFWVRQRITQISTSTGSRNNNGVEQIDVVRIFAANRDGSNLTQLFENNRLVLDTLSVELIDILADDPQYVLMGTWGNAGFTLYRVNIANGRTSAVEDAAWQTTSMMVNRQRRAIMRIDVLPYNSGYRIYRRPASGGRWIEAHEVRRGQRAQNRDFAPIAAGPGPSQVYVAARAEGEEFQAIYLYDTSTGELGEPIFRHPRADAAIVGSNPADKSLIYACAETQRWECQATDPSMQRHFTALSAYFENRADFNLDDVSTDGRIWLLSA